MELFFSFFLEIEKWLADYSDPVPHVSCVVEIPKDDNSLLLWSCLCSNTTVLTLGAVEASDASSLFLPFVLLNDSSINQTKSIDSVSCCECLKTAYFLQSYFSTALHLLFFCILLIVSSFDSEAGVVFPLWVIMIIWTGARSTTEEEVWVLWRQE